MKVLLEKYPKGSFKNQKSDGRYIDSILYKNLELLATKIVNDMTFLAICFSSTLEVGTGKTVLCTQVGEIWTEIMKKVHNIDVPFTMNNLVFRPEDLIERAFQIPKYSFILLDEWEDAHYWSKLGMTLRKFFRKCRQLNLFIMVIIPNFFQLPISYAISRSIFAVDVKFDDQLNRGDYDFYGFKAKKVLYIKGKKFHDYKVVRSDIDGTFFDGYGVPEKEYRREKYLDMLKYDEEEHTPQTEEQFRQQLFFEIEEKNQDLPIYKIAELVGVHKVTAFKWKRQKKDKKDKEKGGIEGNGGVVNTYNIIQSKKKNISSSPPPDQKP